jgi:hypothetical protein
MRRDDLQVVHTITIRNHLGEIEDVERLSCERRSFLVARQRKKIVETPCRYANACALLIILRCGRLWIPILLAPVANTALAEFLRNSRRFIRAASAPFKSCMWNGTAGRCSR